MHFQHFLLHPTYSNKPTGSATMRMSSRMVMKEKEREKKERVVSTLNLFATESHSTFLLLSRVIAALIFLSLVGLAYTVLDSIPADPHAVPFRPPPPVTVGARRQDLAQWSGGGGGTNTPQPQSQSQSQSGGNDMVGSSAQAATAIPSNEADGLIRILADGCKKKYGVITFKNSSALDDLSDDGTPPLLLSFPGAGNTMLRMLIEHATGYYSGSIYLSDRELQTVFEGEKTCTRLNSVIKGHPSDFIIRGQMDLHNRISQKGDKRDKLRGTSKFMRRKCANGKIQHFSRAVLVVREPFKSVFSDFQRIATNSHTGSVSLNQSLKVNLKNVKRSPLKAMNLTDVWLKVAVEKSKDFEQSMLSVVSPLLLSNYSAPPVGNKNPRYPELDFSTLVVRFEDLISKERRFKALASIVKFIAPKERVNEERLMCAFYISDVDSVHRKQSFLDPNELYNELRPSLVCDMWNHTRHFADAFGYWSTPNPAFTDIRTQCAPKPAP